MAERVRTFMDGSRVEQKTKDKVGGKIVFDEDWLYSCPKELFTYY